MTKRQRHCHKLIAETAKEACNTLYDELMSKNELYVAWKKANPDCDAKHLRLRFISRNWGKPECLALARATLGRLLLHTYDENLKQSTYEALVLDNSLQMGRKGKYNSGVVTG